MLSRSGKALALAATIVIFFFLHQCFQPDFPDHPLGLGDETNESHDAGLQHQPVLSIIAVPSASVVSEEKVNKITSPITLISVAIQTTSTATAYTISSISASASESTRPKDRVQKLPIGFPKKIWQTGPKPVTQETRERMDTWLEHNPSFRHEFLTDDGGDAYVLDKYNDRPDILNLYLSLRVPILKADLLRYLILLADGGVWSDIDVSCLGTIDNWVPAEYGDKVNIVVGQEFDYPWNGEGSGLACQFTNWAFMAKPGSKHLQMVVDDIVDELRDIAKEKNVTYSGLKKSHLSDVVNVTGPKKMTVSLLKSLALELKAPVDDRNVSSLKAPVLVGDVLVLPGAAFAAAQAGYPQNQGASFVTHHYAGSWKTEEEAIEE